MIGPAELGALLRVVAGELERRPGDADGLRGHRRPGHLERLQRRRRPSAPPLRARARSSLPRASPCRPGRSRRGSGSPRAGPRPCARRGCRASSPSCPAGGPACPAPTRNAAWPRWPSVGSTVATTMWTSAMPPLVMNTFVPFSTHSSPSRRAVVRSADTSEPAFGLGDAQRADRGSLRGAEHPRGPLQQLLRRAACRPASRAGGPVPKIAERDAGASPARAPR